MARSSGVGGLIVLALLAVIAHAVAPGLLPGGFAGVDVLFVVAGYLGARLIADAEAAGGFGFGAYYARLLRAATPAMLAMLAAVSLAVWALWPAQSLPDYSLTLALSSIFAANIAFAGITEIFGPFAKTYPLLHLWAVGLAMQVLLVLPLVWRIVVRIAPGRLQIALIVLTIVSYWSGIWAESAAPRLAWYMPWGRAWEVLFGVLLVFGELPDLSARWRRAAAALVGLAIVAASFALIDRDMRYPGVATIAPALGAALAIYGGAAGANPVSRFLGARPLALVGAAGLSIYLWWWPALTIARQVGSGPAAEAAGLAVAAAMAAASHVLIERRLRGPVAASDARVVAIAMVGMAALFTIAVLGVTA